MRKLPMKITDENWESEVPFIKKYGKYIRNVEVVCGEDYLIIFRLLDFMPNILKLKVSVWQDASEADAIDPQLMKLIDPKFENIDNLKLESLEFSNSPFFIPKLFFKFLNIKSLKFFSFNNVVDDEFFTDILVPFICQQNSLKYLKIRIDKIDLLFSSNTIDKMNFRLKTLKIDEIDLETFDYTFLNNFLLKQSETLEELRINSFYYENHEIMQLQNLKKLTTYRLLSYFKRNNEVKDHILMPNLKHLQFHEGIGFEDFELIDTSCLPNLKSVNIKFVQTNYLVEYSFGFKLTINPLQNLTHLKKICVEYQGEYLKNLSSPNLENFTMSFYYDLFKTESWTQIAENFPNLQLLTIAQIDDENFLDFIIEYIEDLLYLTDNDRLKVLKLHFKRDDLEIYFKNRKVEKCIGYSCEKYSQLFCNQGLIRKKFKNFDFTLLTEGEFGEKFDDLKMKFF